MSFYNPPLPKYSDNEHLTALHSQSHEAYSKRQNISVVTQEILLSFSGFCSNNHWELEHERENAHVYTKMAAINICIIIKTQSDPSIN
jgi:hypothetical protein